MSDNYETCEICKQDSKNVQADFLCKDCNELLCLECEGKHKKVPETKGHRITKTVEIQHINSKDKLECSECQKEGKNKDAKAICTDCEPIQLLCFECQQSHKKTKPLRKHRIETSLDKYESTVESCRPGKPQAEDIPKADSVHLSWSPPQKIYNQFGYQILFKTTLPSDEWTPYEEQFKESSGILKSLKSDTTFIFKVRMVINGRVGPCSEMSDEIKTKQFAAKRLIMSSSIVKQITDNVTIRKLQLVENEQARNEEFKTRSFSLGLAKGYCKEKTILLVGATGTGKSTMVDYLINYILGVSWDDSFRFTLADLEDKDNEADSQTQWITNYCINPQDGSRLDYKLNIIDMPGFGSTEGLTRDQHIVEQLRHLFSASDETGVAYLDAVCFLVKATDNRLTSTQQYVFTSILGIFGRDIAENIITFTTFAAGKKINILSALKKTKLPHEVYFKFNNDDHIDEPGFWNMGFNSFVDFFNHLQTMKTTSLQQTKEVLAHRYQLEISIENLTNLVITGLDKLDGFLEEINILKQHRTDIEANENFRYTVKTSEQVKKNLPGDCYAMNCLDCKKTCHMNCSYGLFNVRYGCQVMTWFGKCTQCNCSYTQHEKSSYIYKHKVKRVTKIYAEVEKKYRLASEQAINHETVVKRMSDELDSIEQDIFDNMKIVTDCTNELHKIALRSEVDTVVDYIDMLIAAEKQEKKSGYKERIDVLSKCKQKANINEDVNLFKQNLKYTRAKHEMTKTKKTGKGKSK